VYDDVLLLRVPNLNHLDISKSMAIQNDQVHGWLQCICSPPSTTKNTQEPKTDKHPPKKTQRAKKKSKTKAARASKAKKNKDLENTAVFEIEEESLLKDGDVTGHFKLGGEDEGDDDDDDDDDVSCSGVGDLSTGGANVSNGQSDDEDDENNDDEDEEDAMDGPIDTVLFGDEDVDNAEDEDDDDEEAGSTVDVLEAQM